MLLTFKRHLCSRLSDLYKKNKRDEDSCAKRQCECDEQKTLNASNRSPSIAEKSLNLNVTRSHNGNSQRITQLLQVVVSASQKTKKKNKQT